MTTPPPPDAIILIGPIRVGKSTVGKILSSKLDCLYTALDDLELGYLTPQGYDHDHAMHIADEEGGFPYYAYRRSFFEDAVIRFLSEHRSGILDMGGGHPIMPEDANQQRVNDAFKPFKNVVLLLPSPSPEDFIPILRIRQGLDEDADDFNELYFKDDTFLKLATHVVYTDKKMPVEIADEIISRLTVF